MTADEAFQEIARRLGVMFLAEVPIGSTIITTTDGRVIVARPGMPPAYVTENGLEEIRPGEE